MTDQERDELLLRLERKVDERDELLLRLERNLLRLERKVDRIDGTMITQAGIESFMKTTFGQMLSDYHIQRGLTGMRETQREQRAKAVG